MWYIELMRENFKKIYKLGDGTFWLDKWKEKGDFGF